MTEQRYSKRVSSAYFFALFSITSSTSEMPQNQKSIDRLFSHSNIVGDATHLRASPTIASSAKAQTPDKNNNILQTVDKVEEELL